jgi:hypothetical protein
MIIANIKREWFFAQANCNFLCFMFQNLLHIPSREITAYSINFADLLGLIISHWSIS